MRYIFPCVPNRVDKGSDKFVQLDNDPEWIAEVKKNGWRCLAMKDELGVLTLMTRRNTVIFDELPDLRAELDLIVPPNSIIDGELIDKRTKDIKQQYYMFDVIRLRGENVHRLPWTERRAMLDSLVVTMHIQKSVPIEVGKRLLFHQAIAQGDEGIVIKKRSAPYPIGVRSCPCNPFWIKIKEVGK